MNNDSYKLLTSRIGASVPVLTVFVAYTSISDYEDEDVETFHVELEFYKEEHTFHNVIVADFNAKIGSGRLHEELHIVTHGLEWNKKGERLSEFIMLIKKLAGSRALSIYMIFVVLQFQ